MIQALQHPQVGDLYTTIDVREVAGFSWAAATAAPAMASAPTIDTNVLFLIVQS